MSEFRPPKQELEMPDYAWMFDVGITRVEGQMGKALQNLYIENWFYIARAPGSSGNHQSWPGGYMDHIRQFNGFVEQQFRLMDDELVIDRLPPEERFTLSEALTVGALHDIEKPFIYTPTEAGHFVRDPIFKDKDAKAKLRDDLISYYGIELTPNQQNAMRYVEGIPDSEYTPGDRIMSPLAALVHMADIYSARICYGMR
jgi:hypothetical protein